MITIFNRKELRITYSLQEQAHIRYVLKDAAIPYSLRVVNRASAAGVPSSGGMGARANTDVNYNYEYIFYVKRHDYSKALGLISRHR